VCTRVYQSVWRGTTCDRVGQASIFYYARVYSVWVLVVDIGTTSLCSGVRPFGVSLLIAGTDSTGSYLYQVDPSGTYWAWKASAIGKNMVNAKTFLEKR
jgi:20S proteasome alpha/beta subunit